MSVCVTGQQCELCGWTTDLLASSVDKTQHGAEQVTGTVISVLICLCVSVCVTGQQCELCGWTTDLQVTGTVISLLLICLCVSVLCVSVC